MPELPRKAEIFSKNYQSIRNPIFHLENCLEGLVPFPGMRLTPFFRQQFKQPRSWQSLEAAGQTRPAPPSIRRGREEQAGAELAGSTLLEVTARCVHYSWKVNGYCLLHPDFQARLFASQPTPRSPVWRLSKQLNASFARLVTRMKSQCCLLPVMLLNNNTRTHSRVLPAGFGETSCLLPRSVSFMGREKVVGK